MRRLALLLAGLHLVAACASRDYGGQPYPIGELHFPLSLTATPDQRYVLVGNANFDLEYRGGGLAVLDVETNTVLKDRGVEIGNFAGDVALLVRDGAPVKAYVPVREDDQVVVIDLDTSDGTLRLSCSADGDSACDDAHRVADIDEATPIGADPFGATVYHEPRLDADLLVVTELAGGGVDVFRLDEAGTPVPLGRVALDLPGLLTPVHVPGTGRLYVPNKFYNAVVSFDLDFGASPLEVVDRSDIVLPVSLATGDYFRRLIAIGDTLYAADRNTDRVVVIDAGTNRVVRTLPAIPGITSLVPTPDHKLLLSSFDDRRLALLDLATGELDTVVGLARRPYELALVDLPAAGLRRAYFSSFTDHRVGVLDLDPTSERYLQLIAFVR
jgi:YVTN family beta-propeller protein